MQAHRAAGFAAFSDRPDHRKRRISPAAKTPATFVKSTLTGHSTPITQELDRVLRMGLFRDAGAETQDPAQLLTYREPLLFGAESLEDLQEHLKDLYRDLNSGGG
jgi:hypothetical protein